MPDKTYPFNAKPGIQLDGTPLDTDYFTDGQHTRFYGGKPKKMNGYRSMARGLGGTIRGQAYVYSKNGYNTLFAGYSGGLNSLQFDDTGFGGGVLDVTPSGFAASADNIWQISAMQSTLSGNPQVLIAHAAPNMDIYSSVDTQVYYCALTPGATLMPIVTPSALKVSGGAVGIYPYLFVYGNGGLIKWSNQGAANDFTTNIQVPNVGNDSSATQQSAQKVVLGLPDRSSVTSGIFFALDKFIRAQFNGESTVFSFSEVVGYDGILSTSSVVEYDGKYYWPGNGRFQVYNGAINELPNNMNHNFFFQNYNKKFRQKIWGIKIPQWNEIWWFFPYGNATECTHAVIHNVLQNTWYSTRLERSAGVFSTMFPYPIMFDLEVDTANKRRVYQHEYGVDQIKDGQILAIPASITYPEISRMTNNSFGIGTGDEEKTLIREVELDLLQTGEMTLDVLGRNYARSPITTKSYSFLPDTQYLRNLSEFRQLQLRLTSNVAGGDFEMGRSLLKIGIGVTAKRP